MAEVNVSESVRVANRKNVFILEYGKIITKNQIYFVSGGEDEFEDITSFHMYIHT